MEEAGRLDSRRLRLFQILFCFELPENFKQISKVLEMGFSARSAVQNVTD
jgi:hypothetical protein